MTDSDKTKTEDAPRDFIRELIRADLSAGLHDGIVTRFPPEPNGLPPRFFGGRPVSRVICNLRPLTQVFFN